jgi:hypothetical protein
LIWKELGPIVQNHCFPRRFPFSTVAPPIGQPPAVGWPPLRKDTSWVCLIRRLPDRRICRIERSALSPGPSSELS